LAELFNFSKGGKGQLVAGQGSRFIFVNEFDKLEKAVDQKTKTVLSKTGLFTRQAVRKTLRKRPKKAALARYRRAMEDRRRRQASAEEVEAARKQTVSPPDEPPFQHVGTLRKLVFYAYDRHRKTVVIGPLKFNSPRARPTGGKTGAELLEAGGQIIVRTRHSRYTALVKPRPYMEPNVITAREKFLDLMEKENL
jgi:hypothetical protein